MEINRNSWHYWIYDKLYVGLLANSGEYRTKTLCQYVRRICVGVLAFAFLVALACLTSMPVIGFAFYVMPIVFGWILVSLGFRSEWLLDGLTKGVFLSMSHFWLVITFYCAIAVAGLIVWLMKWMKLWRPIARLVVASRVPGFFGAVASDIHNRTCTMIKFTGEKK